MSGIVHTDFLIIGSGIVGLSMAKVLRERFPDAKVCILEKEASVGKHASGRNSGVLHSGIYYPPNSLKGKLCVEGAQALREYCAEYQLPLDTIGKVLVPTTLEEDQYLETLRERGVANGATVEIINESALHRLEPVTRSFSGRALHSPRAAVFDPLSILLHLQQKLTSQGVEIAFQQKVTSATPEKRQVTTHQGIVYQFGHLINTAGLQADIIAKQFDIGTNFALIPFKGLYYELRPDSPIRFNGLVYPVPDLRIPFLGVHFTKAVSGKVYAGPTAIPAFGRENYKGLENIDWQELPGIAYHLANQYRLNHQGFRAYTHQEAFRFFKHNFLNAAKALVPSLKSSDLLQSAKVGIRPQLLNKKDQTLVMDFLVESGPHSTHVLNAVSPAYTSAFAFARLVVEQYIQGYIEPHQAKVPIQV